ncbi:MAG TPA: alpha/beta hydrolase [Solirubrobacteraceae bacterium]|jgi:pimeloyl-ACP methyl ester carboxylesterase|nr:alpha/beta hydrolase [Solirubrobacteraceae bacterium]
MSSTTTASAHSPEPLSEANEVRALAALAFEELRAFPAGLREMHMGIARRAFHGAGATGGAAQLAHDELAQGVYQAIGAGAGLLGRAADVALELGGIGASARLSSTPGGSAVIGALNGLIGDRLERSHSALDQAASVRLGGEAVTLERDSLRASFPAASGWIVLFLHGLMGTEFYWQRGAAGAGDTYGARLAEELGCSPVYVRYNTGRHISESGRSVAALLEELVRFWPVPVERIALIGHSMGGLVARSAGHYGARGGQRWARLVRHVITLGTPHSGAPLEQGAHVAAAALSSLPETRMLGSLLRRRSAGIRDLRHGSLVDEDWRGRDPDALRASACAEVPLLEGATHCFVSATITRSPSHPVGRLLGDALVLVPSASGRGRTRRVAFKAEHGHHVSPAHHLALLNHPEVYARLRAWLEQPPDPTPPVSSRARRRRGR